jgi:hypothetical protein
MVYKLATFNIVSNKRKLQNHMKEIDEKDSYRM